MTDSAGAAESDSLRKGNRRSSWLSAMVAASLLGCAGQVESTLDAGVPADAGSTVDSGAFFDSGTMAPDSGSSDTDAGTALPDAGTASKSAKRGVAYDFASAADLAAVSPGVSWWYNWGTRPNAAVPADYASRYAMDYYPMLWNGSFNASDVESFLQAHPGIKFILVMNEPNLADQANLTPQAAAQVWPKYEAVAAAAGVQIVGPQITWGTMATYQDPVAWLDAFLAAYRSTNGKDPQIDYLGFHWYDYGLGSQLDRLARYNKKFWVTEFANWHTSTDGAQIDTLAKQKTQMTEMVATCEGRADVFRYSWFTGRWSPDPHFDSLLAADGQLTELGKLYLSLPH